VEDNLGAKRGVSHFSIHDSIKTVVNAYPFLDLRVVADSHPDGVNTPPGEYSVRIGGKENALFAVVLL
jgi:hypothetical protein